MDKNVKDTIEVLKARIRATQSTLTRLKGQEKELQDLQAEVGKIPKIVADLIALERSLALVKGEEVPEPPELLPRSIRDRTSIGKSIPSLVYSVIKEAGKPLKTDQIFPLVLAKGRKVGKLTMVSAIYRCIKNGQLFTLVAPGTFGLIEWSEQKME